MRHPDVRVHCITADALYGTAPFVDGASVMFGGVQVISQIRSNQTVRVQKRAQPVADYFATHPGTPHTLRIRGGQEVVAIVGSARLYVCAHHTKRFVVALRGYPETLQQRRVCIKQLPCGNEMQGNRFEKACSA